MSLKFQSILYSIAVAFFFVLAAITATSAEKFFNDVKESRPTDIIKFRMELSQNLRESVKKSTKVEVRKDIEKFLTSTKSKYRPMHYTIEEDGSNSDFFLFITVYYDSYQFESFNVVHQPGMVGINFSNEFKDNIINQKPF